MTYMDDIVFLDQIVCGCFKDIVLAEIDIRR